MNTMIATADLCDRFLDAPRGLQVLAPGLRSYGGRTAYCGPIATAAPGTALGAVRLRDLLCAPGAGRVLVVDGQANERWAVLGDQLVALGQRNGWAGIVLNGYLRDVRALGAIDIGVHALGATPARPRDFDSHQSGATLDFLRTRFTPGSWLYADEDGIVVCAERQERDGLE